MPLSPNTVLKLAILETSPDPLAGDLRDLQEQINDLVEACKSGIFQLQRFNVGHHDRACGPALDHLTKALKPFLEG